MARKIRFALEMENGAEARDMKTLRENFSLERALFYYENGKLLTWLRDRYETAAADAIEALDPADPEFNKMLCAALGVEYAEESEADLERAAEHNRKLNLLEEADVDSDFTGKVDQMAFDQDGLYDLLDEGATELYLCGDSFSIPLSQRGVHYIGVNNPTVIIDAKEPVDWEAQEISLTGVRYDAAYQAVEDAAKAPKILEESVPAPASRERAEIEKRIAEIEQRLADFRLTFQEKIQEIKERELDSLPIVEKDGWPCTCDADSQAFSYEL